MGVARRLVAVVGGIDQLRPADLCAQQLPEALGLAHQEDPAVARAVELGRHEVGVGRARHPGRDQALVQIPGRGVAQLVQGDVEQADLDVAPDAGRARRMQAAHQGKRGGHAGHEVDHREAEARGRRVGLAGDRQKAALGLDQEVVARPAFARPVIAVSREMGAHDLGVERREIGVAQPQLLRLVAAHVAEQAIGGDDQLLEHRAALRVLEVEGHAISYCG